jgi:hypothetical protein
VQLTSGVSDACSRRCSLGSRCSQDETVFRLPLIFHPVLIHCIPPDHHQLSIILDILGTPSLDDFYAITSQRSREYIRALPFRKKKPFSSLFPNANPLVCAHMIPVTSKI